MNCLKPATTEKHNTKKICQQYIVMLQNCKSRDAFKYTHTHTNAHILFFALKQAQSVGEYDFVVLLFRVAKL